MTDQLERRYQRLMLFYPADRRRSGEIVDTLLQGATPGQRRPGVRDTWALITGGLRARVGVDQQLGRGVNVRLALALAAALVAAQWFAGIAESWIGTVQVWIQYGANQQPSQPEWFSAAFGVGCLAVAVLIWTRYRRSTLVAALATTGVALWTQLGGGSDFIPLTVLYAVTGLALVAVIAWSLRRHDPPLPRPWVWLVVVNVVISVVFSAVFEQKPPDTWWFLLGSFCLGNALLALVVLGAVIDARPVAGFATFRTFILLGNILAGVVAAPSEPGGLSGYFRAYPMTPVWEFVLLCAVPLIAIAGFARLRRQART